MTAAAALAPGAYAAALSTLPGVGPRTLCRWLAAAPPEEVWRALGDGTLVVEPGVFDVITARAALRSTDVAAVWQAQRACGARVTWVGDGAYPGRLTGDPAAPGVLFFLGDPGVLGADRNVAIVGTRSATRYGLGVAAQLGADLAAVGVSVSSGLALGIDGAAHEGACAGCVAAGDGGGPPVGVVAGGLDVPYPARHAGLWRRVAEAGVIVSTSPVGTAVERGRFPQRNRLLAALCDVAVVVESHHTGGSISTALEAAQRGRPVGAVPGSIRSPASAGTNDLLADGCFVVRDVGDVQSALELCTAAGPRTGRATPTAAGAAAAARVAATPASEPAVATGFDAGGGVGPAVSPSAALVLAALGSERCSVDQLVRRTGLDLARLCVTLETLSAEGRLVGEGGWWEHA